jgi:hypothetical protein
VTASDGGDGEEEEGAAAMPMGGGQMRSQLTGILIAADEDKPGAMLARGSDATADKSCDRVCNHPAAGNDGTPMSPKARVARLGGHDLR